LTTRRRLPSSLTNRKTSNGTNEEIAALQQMKLCTVKKCLERMFVKLGAENRTAASSHARLVTEHGDRI